MIKIFAEDYGRCNIADGLQVSAQKIQTASVNGVCLDIWTFLRDKVKSKLYGILMHRENLAYMGYRLNIKVQ